jgi:DNA-binding transcriptional ArsR family regulator
MSDIFKALADPTRRQILADLSKGPLAAGEIGSRFNITGPSISRHLGVLKGAGLVSERRNGNKIIYSLESDHLAVSMSKFLGAVCPTQAVIKKKAARRQNNARA